MIGQHLFVILSCLLFLLFNGCASAKKDICSRVQFTEPEKISFSDNEHILVCGDKNTASWNNIPPAQAEFTLRNLLRQRGYFDPKFTWKNEVLSVDPGDLRMISSVTFKGEPEHFHDLRLRGAVGKPLTSKNLDFVQTYALNRLKNLGYGCPNIKIEADDRTGATVVSIEHGPQYTFGIPSVPDSNDEGLHENTMRRFDAFVPGKPYRQEWLELSSNRAENDGIVISSEFISQCPGNKGAEAAAASPDVPDGSALGIDQKILGGDKRLITIGAGASTEEFPIAELRFKAVRLDRRGSHLEVILYGSQRRQKIQTTYTDVSFRNAPRFDFAPQITAEHRKERTFNTTDFQLQVPAEYHGDTNDLAWLVAAGPAVTRTYSIDNTSNKTTTLFSVFGRAMLTSHDYELYLTDPRSGWYTDLETEFFSEGFSFKPFASAYELSGSYLFRINKVEPAQWIFGVRWGLGTVDTAERPAQPGRLPARHFLNLGGDANLRGFGRQELNLGTTGALTSVFAGAEFRYAKTLPLGIEPFTFFDIGSLGANPWSLEPVYFWNPGVGLRLFTPFGAVRGTIAHGFVSNAAYSTTDAFQPNNLEHFQIFFSFGREF